MTNQIVQTDVSLNFTLHIKQLVFIPVFWFDNPNRSLQVLRIGVWNVKSTTLICEIVKNIRQWE